ncbi:MAG: hypothetical protein H6684_04455 [Deltaproteobacteria bacterium]|nr:hypothetical protein [Deltaproteobacteria bacterium]MCB9487963.1 hypothetical protein [Deltaproteobacteria bacterium]
MGAESSNAWGTNRWIPALTLVALVSLLFIGLLKPQFLSETMGYMIVGAIGVHGWRYRLVSPVVLSLLLALLASMAGFPPVRDTYVFFIVTAILGVIALAFRRGALAIVLLVIASITFTLLTMYGGEAFRKLMPGRLPIPAEFWMALFIGGLGIVLGNAGVRARMRWLLVVLIFASPMLMILPEFGFIFLLAIALIGHFAVPYRRLTTRREYLSANAWAATLAGMIYFGTGSFYMTIRSDVPYPMAGSDPIGHLLLGISIGGLFGALGWLVFRPDLANADSAEQAAVSENVETKQRAVRFPAIRRPSGRAVWIAVLLIFSLWILGAGAFIACEPLRRSTLVVADDNANQFRSDMEKIDLNVLDGSELVLTWREDSTSGGTDQLHMRSYRTDVRQFGSIVRLNQATDIFMGGPRLAVVEGDRRMLIWADTKYVADRRRDTKIFGRNFDPTGDPQGDEFLILKIGHSGNDVDVARGKDGRFAVMWQDFDRYPTMGIFTPFGETIGEPFPVNTTPVPNLTSQDVADNGENIVAVWERRKDKLADSTLLARVFSFDGTAISEEIDVTSVGGSARFVPFDVSMNASGEFVVVWSELNDRTLRYGARKFDAAGRPTTGELELGSYSTSFLPRGEVRALLRRDGGFGVVYQAQTGVWGWLARHRLPSPGGKIHLKMYAGPGAEPWDRTLDSSAFAVRRGMEVALEPGDRVTVIWKETVYLPFIGHIQLRAESFNADGSRARF